MYRPSAIVLLALLVVATIGCDRITKRVATSQLAGAPAQSFLHDVVRLDYAENTGAFLGLGADWPPSVRTAVFVGGNSILLIGMLVFVARRHWPAPERVGLALYVAGAVSNLADRLAHGAVVDFLNLGIGPLRTGIFNMADVAIMLGAGLLVVSSSRRDEDPPPSRPQSGPPAASP